VSLGVFLVSFRLSLFAIIFSPISVFSILLGQSQFGTQIMRQPVVKAKQNQSGFSIMKTAVPNNPSETNIPLGPKNANGHIQTAAKITRHKDHVCRRRRLAIAQSANKKE
jgi:hypothetical protein